jgi:hypothetical protein
MEEASEEGQGSCRAFEPMIMIIMMIIMMENLFNVANMFRYCSSNFVKLKKCKNWNVRFVRGILNSGEN